jgi:hypothetical protein
MQATSEFQIGHQMSDVGTSPREALKRCIVVVAAVSAASCLEERIIVSTVINRRYNVDQGLLGSELFWYTKGMWSGVRIRAMSRTMTLATPSTGSLA